ncbi:uncharacterized protein B0I36DRAFT_352843 [Microdochium trichocladiopsis]|uniref:Uncharacterized protein n=1 Tax=Microdochium trichocladiopsis TaxID=1682393 RepID=A0A9P8XYX7_9PEZI|nr:uncharacterized protein B0I36DRAFT_352843 [Microdochium trichocladiopsis]KAH7024630.1 hypothetical protein B0I36DRAFT_352843 [Microdochium trichocladiopsis]
MPTCSCVCGSASEPDDESLAALLAQYAFIQERLAEQASSASSSQPFMTPDSSPRRSCGQDHTRADELSVSNEGGIVSPGASIRPGLPTANGPGLEEDDNNSWFEPPQLGFAAEQLTVDQIVDDLGGRVHEELERLSSQPQDLEDPFVDFSCAQSTLIHIMEDLAQQDLASDSAGEKSNSNMDVPDHTADFDQLADNLAHSMRSSTSHHPEAHEESGILPADGIARCSPPSSATQHDILTSVTNIAMNADDLVDFAIDTDARLTDLHETITAHRDEQHDTTDELSRRLQEIADDTYDRLAAVCEDLVVLEARVAEVEDVGRHLERVKEQLRERQVATMERRDDAVLGLCRDGEAEIEQGRSGDAGLFAPPTDEHNGRTVDDWKLISDEDQDILDKQHRQLYLLQCDAAHPQSPGKPDEKPQVSSTAAEEKQQERIEAEEEPNTKRRHLQQPAQEHQQRGNSWGMSMHSSMRI